MVPPANAALPARINVATRKQHTELNRLLVHRLALALPPDTDTPVLYGKGIVPFARIFLLFEVEWDLLIRQFNIRPESKSAHEQEVRRWLANLRPNGLARSQRLKHDLKHLRHAAGTRIYNTADLGEEWIDDMRGLIRREPHVLVAFAWVFYMAVFSGGRWIRQQLANGGPEFWTPRSGSLSLGKSQQSSPLEMPGFSFLSFDGDQDGEELKALFKTRLAEAEHLLTPQEQEQVIDTAQALFDRSLRLVGELDRIVWKQRTLGWMSWIPWILVAASVPLMLLYGSGYSSKFAAVGRASS